ncbi:hypothetical protein CRG98_006251, partial [Punica granatum]
MEMKEGREGDERAFTWTEEKTINGPSLSPSSCRLHFFPPFHIGRFSLSPPPSLSLWPLPSPRPLLRPPFLNACQ